jgi:8-amino-7-oxononanoate synthase
MLSSFVVGVDGSRACYATTHMDLDTHCQEKLAGIRAKAQARVLVPTQRLPGMVVERGGQRLIDFSSNDSLGLSFHPEVVAAAQTAATHGVGAGASRLVSGDSVVNAGFEEDLARSKQAARSLLFSSGYAANLGVVPALVGAGDAIIIDALAHACLMSASKLSGARVVVVPHNDVVAVARALDDVAGSHALVITESVFSMDGDRAPLEALRLLTQQRGAWLLVDDAHGAWVGQPKLTMAHADVITTTLSKALGSMGGAVCGPASLIELLCSRARTQVYSTGLPPMVVAAAHAALRVAVREEARCARPLLLAQRFCAALGLPVPASHIVPWQVGDDAAALLAMQKLQAEGLLVVAIRAPTVPAGTARLRISFSAAHTDSDVDRLIQAMR